MSEPRLTTVMGVARAVLSTVGARDAAAVLIDEYGWDATFQALALLRGDEACVCFGEVWTTLVLDATAAALHPALGAGPSEDRRTYSDEQR